MDALALLCNLHADGPATLQRLRRASCDSLTALRRLEPASLAEVLGWNERAAERFLREAALLCERVQEEDPLVRDTEQPFELEAALDGEEETEEEESDDYEDAEDEAEDDAPGSARSLPVEQAEAVLGEWRELDRVAPPADPAEFVIPRPVPPPDLPLDDCGLPELTLALRARLAELGVRTLRALVDGSELELSRALPLGFTRLRRLQLNAARELERLPSNAPLASFDAFTPPPNEPFEIAGPSGAADEPFETAGPFA